MLRLLTVHLEVQLLAEVELLIDGVPRELCGKKTFFRKADNENFLNSVSPSS